MHPRIKILVEALQMIQSYDHNGDGICPYGCDTPYIAKEALEKFDNAECYGRQDYKPDIEDLKDAERFRWVVENKKWFQDQTLSFVRDKLDFEMEWELKAKTNP